MKKKLIGLTVCLAMIASILPMTAMAGSVNDNGGWYDWWFPIDGAHARITHQGFHSVSGDAAMQFIKYSPSGWIGASPYFKSGLLLTEPGVGYSISFMYKHDVPADNNKWLAFAAGAIGDGFWGESGVTEETLNIQGKQDWTEYVFPRILTATAAEEWKGVFRFDGVGSIWIDDITVKVASLPNEYGGSLSIDDVVVSIDFEEFTNNSDEVITQGLQSWVFNDTSAAVSNAGVTEVGINSAKITWDNPTLPTSKDYENIKQQSFGGTKIYQVTDDGDKLVGVTTYGLKPGSSAAEPEFVHPTSFVVEGLQQGTDYTFKVKSYDAIGVQRGAESAPINFSTAGSAIESLKILKEVDTDVFEEITALEVGEVTAEAVVSNWQTSGDPEPAILVLVLFKDEVMVDVGFSQQESLDPGDTGVSLTATVTVPGDGPAGYKVNAFLWESTNSMKPLVRSLIMDETGIIQFPFDLSTTLLINGMEDAAQWADFDPYLTGFEAWTANKTEGNQSVKVTFQAPSGAEGAGDAWYTCTWTPDSPLDLSQADKILIDIYPLQKYVSSGGGDSQEPINWWMPNNGLDIRLPGILVPNTWNTVEIDISGVANRDNIPKIGFYAYNGGDYLWNNDSFSYYIDNIRAK